MRGIDVQARDLFSYVQLKQRVPLNHPLRAIRQMVDVALGEMDALFAQMYSDTGRPSKAPERLLRAQTLQILYTVRSERQLMEQIDFNLKLRAIGRIPPFEAILNAYQKTPDIFYINPNQFMVGLNS